MIAFAIILLSIGAGDAAHGLAGMPLTRRRAMLATIVSVVTAIVAVAAASPTADGVGIVTVVVVVAGAWQFVRVSFPIAALQLATIAAGIIAAALVSTVWDNTDAGLWGDFIAETEISVLRRHGPAIVLLVLGLSAVMVATANAVVRIVLEIVIDGTPPTTRIRGGRVIGPLERLLIVGFVIAGTPTTAALVVTAKSLLRYPELRQHDDVDIHAVTEYVLIGSLVSWSLALVGSLLVA